jgi:hypothetical protein
VGLARKVNLAWTKYPVVSPKHVVALVEKKRSLNHRDKKSPNDDRNAAADGLAHRADGLAHRIDGGLSFS